LDELWQSTAPFKLESQTSGTDVASPASNPSAGAHTIGTFTTPEDSQILVLTTDQHPVGIVQRRSNPTQIKRWKIVLNLAQHLPETTK